MTEHSWLSLVRSQRAIAVIRAPNFDLGIQMARAIAASGMKLIEITWNSEQAAKLVYQLRAELPDCSIGAGTLLTSDQVKEAIGVGSQFLFTPHTNPTIIQAAVGQKVPIVPGALSPTEIVAAWQAGASAVKVFPIQSVGGAAYIRHLQAPLGQIPFIPTGGVTVENAKEFIEAGAIAVGLSGQLFPKGAIVNGDWAMITQRAKELMGRMKDETASNYRLTD
ncbi:MAG: bifunctional 4-hydroxy-2-oxoglutarate aldolase/2-dehydro-3-deoxy-phosphogluconate aldolase [Cyanobacteria bacterium CRU_2_1]|nr:bifunctional 4-hydroxy-2-oxoglutarate aldolase/2-dehydro-3-deoxy-phosphogluconate aldolase [Cyanobacteria bacterium RU_5_0]NJR60092.1 bifunctional 4-hydroxy-2-oxoglutarate aldolase/2-dehydro-3-deoxy-phosphogluconate aldolase [Cyanobacteria bacterium CRU_2_1]